MIRWLSLVILFSPSSWAIEGSEQVVIDDFIRAHPTETASAPVKNPTQLIEAVKKSADQMSVQANSIDTQLNSANPKLTEIETLARNRTAHSNLYENEHFKNLLVTQLREECCKFVNEPGYFQHRKENIDRRWKEIMEKRKESSK
jgi:hypothetical protein